MGGGISGSATAHFLRTYSTDETKTSIEIEIFEKESMVGGRMSSIELSEGEFFESGGTILHPKNYHSLRFTELLGLKRLKITDEGNFGIWNGSSFIFVTQSDGTSFFSKKWSDFVNLLSLLWRYKLNLFRMNNYVSVSSILPSSLYLCSFILNLFSFWAKNHCFIRIKTKIIVITYVT